MYVATFSLYIPSHPNAWILHTAVPNTLRSIKLISYIVAVGDNNVTSVLFLLFLLLGDKRRPHQTMAETVRIEHCLVATRDHYLQSISVHQRQSRRSYYYQYRNEYHMAGKIGEH